MTKSNQTPRPADLLPDVTAAVREAGKRIRAEANRPGGPRGQGGKAPVDSEAEHLLKRQLSALHPCGWHGEETDADKIGDGDIWVVDPHDGTNDFLKGLRGSAVSVALLRGSRPVLGVVCAPLAPDDGGDLFAWAEGAALTRNGQPVTPREQGLRVLALNADAADYAAHNQAALPGWRIRAVPSPAYRLALAAAGEIDAGISLVAGLWAWDIAGGHALLLGAGGVLTDRHGRSIDYRRASFDGVIGGRKEAVAALANRLPTSGHRERHHPARPAVRVSDATRLSRAQGCLLGQLSGDALGSAVEFRSAAEIARSHPGGVRDLTNGGTWGLIAGQPTDDSEMALALARSLVLRNGFDMDAVVRAYFDWCASKPFDIGGTTASGIAALEAGRRPTGSTSQANGALMRVRPIGILAAGDSIRAAALAREDAALTHPHPVCRAANAAYAAAIAAGIDGADERVMWETAREVLDADPNAQPVRERLDAARQEGPVEFQRQMGWVLIAFQNAFHWLLSGASLEEAVIATVGKGGDTDTNAAICGALLGAAQGREAVPLRWRNAVLTCRPVKETRTRHLRPATYWPDDALALAEALLAAGV